MFFKLFSHKILMKTRHNKSEEYRPVITNVIKQIEYVILGAAKNLFV